MSTDIHVAEASGPSPSQSAQNGGRSPFRIPESMVRAILSTRLASLVILDVRAHILFANAAAEELLGLTRPEHTDRAYNAPEWKLQKLDGTRYLFDELPYVQAHTSGQSVEDIPIVLAYPNGKESILALSAYPLPREPDAADDAPAVAVGLRDITETHRLNAALRESEARLRQMAEAIEEAVWLRTADRVLYANPAFERIFDTPLNALVDQPESFMNSIHPDDRARVQKALQANLDGSGHFQQTYRVNQANGETRWLYVQSYPVNDPDYSGRSAGTATDITERVLLEQRLENLATTDCLTGLYNRREFTRRTEIELDRLGRHPEQSSCLLMLDIDHFKRVNDRFGHSIGDNVLEGFSQALNGHVRPYDVAARLGGEEFAVLLVEVSLEQCLAKADQIRETLANTLFLGQDNSPLRVTVSVGCTELRPGGDDPLSAALNRADSALYAAKASGRNQSASR